jgi:hypothetical protein
MPLGGKANKYPISPLYGFTVFVSIKVAPGRPLPRAIDDTSDCAGVVLFIRYAPPVMFDCILFEYKPYIDYGHAVTHLSLPIEVFSSGSPLLKFFDDMAKII